MNQENVDNHSLVILIRFFFVFFTAAGNYSGEFATNFVKRNR